MNKDFVKITRSIMNYYVGPFVLKEVYIKKADAKYLCVSCNDPFGNNMIMLLDGKHDKEPNSVVKFRLVDNNCYISHFHTMPDSQSKGLGRYVYDTALGYADMLGYTHSDGCIFPCAEITAVSNRDAYNQLHKIKEDVRLNFLIECYTALGNKVEPDPEGIFDYVFSCNWESGEKLSSLNNDQSIFVEEIYEANNPESESN